MSTTEDRLYTNLPSIYRVRDDARGQALRALLGIMEEEFGRLEADIARQYDNWFIETCDEWVIPYIGELLGNRPLHDVVRTRRADVAKTLYYRRRKATLPMLEELARDVTGWDAHAVAFFEHIGWTQHLNHLRFRPAPELDPGSPYSSGRIGTVNLRATELLNRVGTAFDEVSHTVDVRPTDRTQGRYNLRNIGFFLWRLQSYPMNDVEARQVAEPNDHGFHFSTFGNPAPLFVAPDREADPTGLASEVHVGAPIRPEALEADLRDYRERWGDVPPGERPASTRYYGPDRSFHIVRGGNPVDPLDLVPGDLADWCRPEAGKVGVDVARGRITFAEGETPRRVRVDYAYGFSADMGGGPYDRRATMADLRSADFSELVRKGTPTRSLQRALSHWTDAGRPDGVIQVEDNRVYGGNLGIDLPAGCELTIQAANGVSPDLRMIGNLRVTAPAEGATLILNGLQIEGGIRVSGNLTLRLEHCTIVPGRMLAEDGAAIYVDRDSMVVSSGDLGRQKVTVIRSIVGPIRLPIHSGPLHIEESIVQALEVDGVLRPAIAATDPGDAPGPPATIVRSTIFGPVFLPELMLASEVIFVDELRVQRRQSGCVRFSYVPPGSRTPRRYRCQPDLALDGVTDAAERDRVVQRLVPDFNSTRFGEPDYAQLSWRCAEQIRTGAEDGAEMGAFHHLAQPHREANLRKRLEEYLPFGREAGFIYMT